VELNPDLILMDIQMPGMDGLEATRHLRSTPEHAATPIIALSASADDDSRKASIQAGCNAHLAKPASMTDLNTVLTAYLRQK
jgi:CheY-like chemotaxis protein